MRTIRFAVAVMLLAPLWAWGEPHHGTVKVSKSERRGVVSDAAIEEALGGARRALFEDSNLDAARKQAEAVLRSRPAEPEALFIVMEAAALEADTSAELEAALRLCESAAAQQQDPRASIAAARLLELAGNTAEFRALVPRIQQLTGDDAHNGVVVKAAKKERRRAAIPQANYLRAALIAAASDGAGEPALPTLARQAGLITDWTIAGPFGRRPNLDFDHAWPPERDALQGQRYGDLAVEKLQFDNGDFTVPEYFEGDGVFYAAASFTLNEAATRYVRAESPGTLEVRVDGVEVICKDSRQQETPDIVWRAVSFSRGEHRVLVKFLRGGAPFRVSVLPSGGARNPMTTANSIAYKPEADYVRAAGHYWEGDYAGALSGWRELEARRASAVAEFAMSRAWSRAQPDAPELPGLLTSAAQKSGAAMAAEYELASRAFSAGRTEEALSRLQQVMEARPRFGPGQQLMEELARGMHWQSAALQALRLHLEWHPTCEALRAAVHFFAVHARFEDARSAEDQLQNCAPDTLAYAQQLSEGGSHEQAAAWLKEKVAARPLEREAREMLAQELVLADKPEAAHVVLAGLAELAPNSARYRRLASGSAEAVLDNGRNTDDAVYQRYRRDGRALAQATADRIFSGGPAVTVLLDRVASLTPGGQVSIYYHQVTRVLDRDGIEQFGEVEIPKGAQILELRTLKADGSAVEPELSKNKTTISMPALAAGDAVEVEYVLRYDGGGMAEHAEAFRQTFGSFVAPILFSRFVVLTPAAMPALVEASPSIHAAATERFGDRVARTWEQNDIAQSVEEAAISGNPLPTVGVQPRLPSWTEVRDDFRETLITATKAGPRVEAAAHSLRRVSELETARAIYRYVSGEVRASQSTLGLDVPGAEETLASHSGSRSMVMLAIARAAGLDADLLLARKTGTRAADPGYGGYSRPLVVVHFREVQKDIALDLETDGIEFGAIDPKLERRDALLIPPVLDGGRALEASALVPVPAAPENERSTAEAAVRLDQDGTLEAQVKIVLGAWRGAQMRALLASIAPEQRGHFYQQLASRIFPGASEARGQVMGEGDTDHPLQLQVWCRAVHFVSFVGGQAELDQLVPALGLRKLYVGTTARQFPLFVDTPLIESATFRVELPLGVRVVRSPGSHDFDSDFGSYSVHARQIASGMLEIQRSFDVPVQVIPPERYPDFARFAERIEDAEHERITLGMESARR